MKSTYTTLLLITLSTLMSFKSESSAILKYDIEFHIESISNPCNAVSIHPSDLNFSFGCELAIGDIWRGSFVIQQNDRTLDDGPLSTPFYSVNINTGNIGWRDCESGGYIDCSSTNYNQLAGYRDGATENFENTGGPGFNIVNGRIQSILGGVYNVSDAAFIDFDYIYGANNFGALDEQNQAVRGSYFIFQVPNMNTFILLFLPMIVLFWCRMKQSRKTRC